MPVNFISQQFVSALDGKKLAKREDHFDTELKGFIVELRPNGVRTFYLRYRDTQRAMRQVLIGRHPLMLVNDARAKAHQLKEIVRQGGDPQREAVRSNTVPTYGEFIAERYLPHIKIHKRSWETDVSILENHLLPRFAKRRMTRITRADVQEMLVEGSVAKYKAGTINRWLILLRFSYNCAIRWEILPEGSNPTRNVDLYEDNGARERYLTEDEVRRLLGEIERNRNTQVGQIVKLLLLTGARKREILDAQWRYIDFERCLLTVPLSKSGKPRHIPLSDMAIDLLRNLPRDDAMPWVFFNPKTGKPPVSIFYAWHTMRSNVGLGDVRMHDLRHSYASFLVNQGRSLYEVQRLLGHADAKTTQRYAHLSPGALLDAVNVVGDVVGRSSVARPVAG